VDERVQVSQMSREARGALAQRIRSRLSHAENPAADHDVSIVGGGVAALTLALEIRRARPNTRIQVIEPKAHPVPESPTRSGSRPSRCRHTIYGTAWVWPTT
jgi:hypothetical protein